VLSIRQRIEHKGTVEYRATLRKRRWLIISYAAIAIIGGIALGVFNVPGGVIVGFSVMAVGNAFVILQQHYTYALYQRAKVMYERAVPYLYEDNSGESDYEA
jgi:hypothetical protein